jgi:alkylation response protein AidB-like acyl-CoA dehydrogenase
MTEPKKTTKLASELEARELAEGAREDQWAERSFARALFGGTLPLHLIDPLPPLDPDEQARAAEFLKKLERFALEHIDGDKFDRDGWVPDEVLKGLAQLGAFGIKIPREYGGLGLGQLSYNRALAIVSSRCGATGAFLSAHQSIGVPAPLIYFGTEAQKRRYLPRLAAGALSAFALTEPDAGSDPANMETHAELSPDGKHWILNGEKLWTTNGPRAELIVVMARTPARPGVKGKRPVTAFIVESAWEGVSTEHVCHFMGLKALSNGVMHFKDVKVPTENLLWEEGKGLKLALITLNTGRLSLPAFCASAGKASLETCRTWARERVQWGQPIGKHDAIAQMMGRMAADTFAMESIVEVTSRMADAHTFDIRLEAAFAKMWNSERAWQIANDCLQIRGGRGYETHDSLLARGETPLPVERMVRDLRINLIFEGSSEIMRLFIAREAVDDHLTVAGDLVNPKAPTGKRVTAAVKAGAHYAWWFPSRFIGWGHFPRFGAYGPLATHVRYADRVTRKLARSLFYAMTRFGPSLEKRQAVLGRLVDVGAELFAMAATCVVARQRVDANPKDRTPYELADVFCRNSRMRIEQKLRELFKNADSATYKVAKGVMEDRYIWIEEGVISLEEVYLSNKAKQEEAAKSGPSKSGESRTRAASAPREKDAAASPAGTSV